MKWFVPLFITLLVGSVVVTQEDWKMLDSTPQSPKSSHWVHHLYGMSIECEIGIEGGAVFYSNNRVYVFRTPRGGHAHDAGEFENIHKAKQYLAENVGCENDR